MENTETAVAESSPASPTTFEVPTDAAANLEWRKTGNVPAAKPDAGKPKEESAPSKTASADRSSEEDAAETAAASAPANKQEKAKSESAAASRLNELLADLKRAGLNPAELKTFKREAKAAEQSDSSAAKPAEKTGSQTKPQQLEAPVKPKRSDFDTWEKYEDAKDEYVEKLTAYTAKAAVMQDRQQRAAETMQQEVAQKLSDAKARYGDQAEDTIRSAANTVFSDGAVPQVVRDLLDESTVLVDVMYVLGSKPDELAAFVALAKSNPGAAVRKAALIEHLVQEELQKGSSKTAAKASAETADEGDSEVAERDENGKFVSQKPPAKQKSAAPPPPEELSTRRSAPTDPIEAAVRNDDFAAFKAEEDRRDIARRKGA